jgi:nucleoside-diphosphate-sugar epimerase
MECRNMPDPRKVLVTGATGFIGQALTASLLQAGLAVRAAGLGATAHLEALGAEISPLGAISGATDWSPYLDGIDAVVHLAGVAHRMEEQSATLDNLFDQVNHQATASLARAIGRQGGIERFLFASSVAVHGEPEAWPLTAQSPCRPTTPYGLSKLNAEQAIGEALTGSTVAWGIIRPVLVYGPGNPGNMARLLGLIRRGIPVPVRSTPNQRHFLYLGNLLSAVQAFLRHEAPPAGKAWLIADREAVSTRELVGLLAQALGRPGRTLVLPDPLLKATAWTGDLLRAAGIPSPWTTDALRKLLGDFVVDARPIQEDLGWLPPFTLEEGVRSAVQAH